MAVAKRAFSGGEMRKAIAISWPPVRWERCWTRSIVDSSLTSETVDGERRRMRSWRVSRPVFGPM